MRDILLYMTCYVLIFERFKCCRDTKEEASPLQLGMTSDLLADSFMKTLFTRFYHTLQLHSPISHKGLQASALAYWHLDLIVLADRQQSLCSKHKVLACNARSL